MTDEFQQSGMNILTMSNRMMEVVIIIIQIIRNNIFVDMCQRTLTHPEAVDCFKQSEKKEGHLVKRTRFYP